MSPEEDRAGAEAAAGTALAMAGAEYRKSRKGFYGQREVDSRSLQGGKAFLRTQPLITDEKRKCWGS